MSWTRLPSAQRWMIALIVLAVALASIEPPYPEVAPLHHAPTLLLALAAPWLLGRWPLSNAAVGCLFAFLILHTLGGRYTYSNVPYDDWARSIAGSGVSEIFGFTRNHFDRLVHLAFGVLAVPFLVEVLCRYGSMPPRRALLFALLSVLAASASYEIFEWQLAIVAAGPLADEYNGQQGDSWDAQKDMALAALGAFAALFWLALRPQRCRA